MNIVPFSFESHQIRTIVDTGGEPWFVAADVCAVLEIENTTNAVRKLDPDEVQVVDFDALHSIKGSGNNKANIVNESGLYTLILRSRDATTPGTIAHRFRKWVTSEVLPAIRKTGSYTAPKASKPRRTSAEVQAAQAFRALMSVAKLIGLDRNAAAISANNSVARTYGTNLLQELGATHLEAEQQVRWCTPTEIGQMLGGLSGMAVNKALESAGLQVRQGDVWEPTDSADRLCRRFDTGKRHSTGVPVQQIKWSADVARLIH